MSYGGRSQGNFAGRWQGKQSIPSTNANTFDTGVGKALRSLVQEGVIQLLQRLLIANGGYLQTIEATRTVVKSAGDEQGLSLIYDLLKGRAPSLAVSTAHAMFKPSVDVFRWQKDITVHVYFFANSLRSGFARVAGDVVSAGNRQADPGLYTILEHVEELLIGQTPGGYKHAKELRPQAEDQLDGDNEAEIWHQIYTVAVTRSINEKRDVDLYLKSIETYSRNTTQASTDPPLAETETDIP